MLTTTELTLPFLNIDYNRIELLRKVSLQNKVKVTPALLKKLDEGANVDELLSAPSTSKFAAMAARRVSKRKIELEEKKPEPVKVEEVCSRCEGRLLRVVDPGRADGQLVLECMRANCLASVKFTELPLGTVLGQENAPAKNPYNSLARFYPETQDSPSSSPEPEEGVENQNIKDFIDLTGTSLFISVPGQQTKARLH